jgi:hypothetical protein
MADTTKHPLPHVSLYTDHVSKYARILIAGPHGTLGIEAYAEDPCIALPDPNRGPGKVYALCGLTANGRLRGWFVEKEGATGLEDTKVFFPAPTPRQRPAKARRKKK